MLKGSWLEKQGRCSHFQCPKKKIRGGRGSAIGKGDCCLAREPGWTLSSPTPGPGLLPLPLTQPGPSQARGSLGQGAAGMWVDFMPRPRPAGQQHDCLQKARHSSVTFRRPRSPSTHYKLAGLLTSPFTQSWEGSSKATVSPEVLAGSSRLRVSARPRLRPARGPTSLLLSSLGSKALSRKGLG